MKTTTSHLKEIVMQGVFTACACISILAVALICIFLFANGLPTIFEIGPPQVPAWHHLETRQQPVRHPAHDPGEHLCHRRRDHCGGAHWAADGHLYVPLCIAPYQQGAVAGGTAAGRYPLGRVRLLRHDRYGPGGAGYGQIGLFQNCAAREKRQGHEPVYRQPAAGHHDFAHHHHGQQNQPGRCAPKLLRGQPGSGCYP